MGDAQITTEPIEPVTCMQQLENFAVDIGEATAFDDGRGGVIVTGGEACWNSLLDMLKSVDDMASLQLPMLLQQGIYPQSIGLPTPEEYAAMVVELEDYTDGYAMITSWSWPAEAVPNAGDQAGLCIGKTEDEQLSCWAWTRKDEYGYEATSRSYRVDPGKFKSGNTLIEDAEEVEPSLVPGAQGNWMCMHPYQLWDREMTTCMRLLPKENTDEDPRIIDGDVTVLTYLSTRGDLLLASSGTMSPHAAAFSAFTLSLMSDAAISNLFASAVGLVAAGLLMSF